MLVKLTIWLKLDSALTAHFQVQFLLPLSVLVLTHARIYYKLSQLPFWSSQRSTGTGSQHGEARGQRTLYLLVSVVIVFMCSWLPLNMINILNDLGYLDRFLKYLFIFIVQLWIEKLLSWKMSSFCKRGRKEIFRCNFGQLLLHFSSMFNVYPA